MQNKNSELEKSDNYYVARIIEIVAFLRLFYIRCFTALFSIGLLFFGWYNIYRERLIWASALIGSGTLLAFGSLINGGGLL